MRRQGGIDAARSSVAGVAGPVGKKVLSRSASICDDPSSPVGRESRPAAIEERSMISHPFARRPSVESLERRQLLSAHAGGFRDLHATNTYGPKTINLRYYVGDDAIEGTVVDMTYDLGNVRVALLDKTAPATTVNFLKYVDAKRYAATFLHRAEKGFIVQGGGYSFTGGNTQTVAAYAPVASESQASNTRGTLSTAVLGNDPDSATSQWFYNVADNSATLDAKASSGTVFGRVVGGGMTVVDKVAALTTFNAGTAFPELPVQNYDGHSTLTNANLVTLQSVGRVSTVTGTTVLKVTASSNKASLVTTVVKSGKLTLYYSGTNTGTATITVTATGVDGSVATDAFKVPARRVDADGAIGAADGRDGGQLDRPVRGRRAK